MLCDNCKKNEATVHMTRVVNGKKSDVIYVMPVLNSRAKISAVKVL